MSQGGYNGLLMVLRREPKLRMEIGPLVGRPEALLQWACEKGFDLTDQEARQLIDSLNELSDDDLDKVAGGEDAWGSGSTGGTGGTAGTTTGGTGTP